jgi:hypothetical protein
VQVVDPADALEREADAAAGGSGDLVAGHRPGERGAGGFAGARAVLRVPAPPAGKRRDTTHLQITGDTASIDYYAYTAQENLAVYDYTTDTWNRTASWILYDSRDVEVYRRELAFGAGNFPLMPSVVRRHVEGAGPSRLGAWTLRFIKDVYYDDKAIWVGEGTGPGPALTDAQTTTALFNIRQLPSTTARVLSTMSGTPVPVTVTDKVHADGYNWYHITLRAPIGSMAANADGWVREEGVVATVPWSFFRDQLHRWEAQQTGLDLSQRITKLRQMCHNSDLPFDSVIGVGAGTQYLNTRGFVRREWQILRDSQVVRMPDGGQVDVYHLLVGLDVLPRRVERQTYSLFEVGQNYSVATWSGDIGAGVADAVIRQDADWERAMIPAGTSNEEQTRLRTEHYYTSRAPEADLLGDIDAWGIDAMRSEAGAPTTIGELLANFYGTPAAAPGSGGGQVTPRRRAAIEHFLRHYGFNTASSLCAQTGPRDRMQQQIEIFARMWILNRQHVWSDTSGIPPLARAMTDRFLDWLEALARANGANVPGPAASQPTR